MSSQSPAADPLSPASPLAAADPGPDAPMALARRQATALRVSRAAAASAVALGLIALAIWGFGASLPAGPLGALAIALSGSGLLLGAAPGWRRPGGALALTASAIGAGALIGSALGGPAVGLDALSAAAALLVGVAPLSAAWRSRAAEAAFHMGPLAVMALSTLVLSGHLYQAILTASAGPLGAMAAPTAAGFLLIGIAQLAARPQSAGMRLLLGEGQGSALLRRLLPAVLIGPVLLGLLGLGAQRLGWLDTVSGTAVMGLAISAVAAALLATSARSLNGLAADHSRMQALAASRKDEAHAERLQETNEELYSQNKELQAQQHEMAQLNQELFRKKERLASLNAAKDEFISVVSHEVRSPLTVIRHAVSILDRRRAGPLTEPQRRFTQLIIEQTERLNRLVDEILDVQKLESGALSCALARGDVGGVLEKVWNASLPVAEAGGIRLTRLAQDGPLPAEFDGERLTQVFMNLVFNALKFTPRGGSVTIEATCDEREVRVAIVDTGEGIAEENLERVFHKFFQVDSGLSRRSGGTGLGLAICKRLVEDGHGGRIWVESRLGAGSRFTVALPLSPD